MYEKLKWLLIFFFFHDDSIFFIVSFCSFRVINGHILFSGAVPYWFSHLIRIRSEIRVRIESHADRSPNKVAKHRSKLVWQHNPIPELIPFFGLLFFLIVPLFNMHLSIILFNCCAENIKKYVLFCIASRRVIFSKSCYRFAFMKLVLSDSPCFRILYEMWMCRGFLFFNSPVVPVRL